ncbi:metalloenzyme domain protein [Thermosinus carboxydivorans Nor1]|uniref:Metalloenzyme domain protein n=1 Tax=Thermosinus carboxydivorans Nor1 TaxID=401526 RepID=A1HPF5_9FIRM|nr:alkaline phosphatase family protein [Thermosinus carboxydivorans]EAX48257.1 metalloenzyme domain protein [Thermosinus carboxydivorans Nor1]
MHVLLVFVDGFGLGISDKTVNPLIRFHMSFFEMLFGRPLTQEIDRFVSSRACLVPVDARLDTEGLPQSATGQTALLTGVNVAKELGRHVAGFPGPQLTEFIRQYGIMKRLVDKKYLATSANMYMPDYLNLVAARKRRHAVTTLVVLEAGQPLRSVAELLKGDAVYQDLTNEMLAEAGLSVPLTTPALAGRRLVEIACRHHFTMFEYFQTDRCGHKQDWQKAAQIVNRLDEFFGAIWQMAPTDMTVIIASDHGNFEDFSVRTHTYNPVPVIVFGYRCTEVAEQIRQLTDVTPTIIGMLERNENSG